VPNLFLCLNLRGLLHRINTSQGTWSYVLRALELKVKLAGKEEGEWNYEEMLSSLELAA